MADDWTPEKEAAARQNAAGLNSYLTNLTGFGAGGASRTALENVGNNITRNLGSLDPTIKRPDGQSVSTPFGTFDPSKVSALNITQQATGIFSNPSIALNKISSDKATVNVAQSSAAASASIKVSGGIVPNPLEKFASYNVLWTLAVLTPEQFNNPLLYRKDISQLSNIIFSSAGRFKDKRVETAYGTPEFYINNFTMRCVIGSNEKSGNQNAIGFSFDIYEPYSMGLLLQSMQRAARLAKFENYLDNAAYCLRMDFQGYDELGNVYSNIQPKFFTIKITKIAFQVNEGGSIYKVDAVPWNHQAFSDAVNTSYKDCKIGGDAKGPGTVEEILVKGTNSLVNFLNKNEKKLKDNNLIKEEDVYEIQFPIQSNIMYSTAGSPPETNRATVDPNAASTTAITSTSTTGATAAAGDVNEIGSASLGFDQKDGGTIGFKRANEIYDEAKGIKKIDNMIFNAKERVFQFAQKTSLTSIINQVILSSDWAQKTITQRTGEGFIKWFKLDVQVELLKFDELVGDYSKKFIFRIVPYYIHESIFSEVTQKPFGYDQLLEKIVKRYDYLYTGQNVDILKFDIEINNLFFKGAQPAPPQSNAKAANPEQQGVASNPQVEVERKEGSAKEADQIENVGRSRKKRDPSYLKKLAGGSGFRDSQQEIAEEFQKAFLSGGSADLMKVNLEILGDTYWIVDSGFSNYFASADPKSQVTSDGTMNYEAGDVYIYLSFRTPSDVDEATGLYNFNGQLKESPFGGIYRVVQCENTFSDGLWKQKLTCIRMPGPQGPEEGAKKAAQTTDKAGYEFAGIQPEVSRVADDATPADPIEPNIQVA